MQSSSFCSKPYQPISYNMLLNRFLTALMRIICAFSALIGVLLLVKYALIQDLPIFQNNAYSKFESYIPYIVPVFLLVFAIAFIFAVILAILTQQKKKLLTGKTFLQNEISDLRQDIAALAEYKKTKEATITPAQKEANIASDLRFALDKMASPLWLRDSSGQIRYANKAYNTIVNFDVGEASAQNKEQNLPEIENLFSGQLQQSLAKSRAEKQNMQGKTNLVINGNRHIFMCHSYYDPKSQNFIETAEDISEKLHLEGEIKRIQQGYAETFDCLSTAVAIFDPDKKLEFFNSAFSSLWPLENQFLETNPSHTLVLDRLREKGILNERPDWRAWKENLFEAYHALNPQHYTWNLPDGRTLRVVANPHPQGGVTWLFDDLTEKLTLEARYNTLIQMQGETLDNLSEGVAVFGSDGKLRLSNPAFGSLWALPAELVIQGTHIEKIKTFCLKTLHDSHGINETKQAWENFVLYVTGFADKRDFVRGRTELPQKNKKTSRIFDYMVVPLPQGQTMLTFVDVTDSVNIARALHDRNAALESADKLRNDFVQHVSYELRTPLTNIIGFTDLMLAPSFGELNTQQSSYLHHIADQSVTLLNLVNDILDLATVDAGIMELEISTVSVPQVMDYAVHRLKEPLKEKNIVIEQHIAEGLTNFEADQGRVRQIFINLLNNAIKAAPENSHIHFSAEKYKNYISFIVEDEGPGIAPEYLNTIFKRFTSYAYGGHKTGVGLGLSIVKSFVELHQGHVLAESGKGNGTRLICRFPFHDNTIEHKQ